jgi:hypothetical protein
MTIIKQIAPFLVSLAVVAALTIIVFSGSTFQTHGSVEESNEYFATTTGSLQTPAERTIKTGPGALGSVVLTGAMPGNIMFYNATTSNVLLRTGQKPTTTITIAEVAGSAEENTYTYDVAFTDGLLMITSAVPTAPTSTITWR